jgi:dTDP-glucose 4,6-dehydratase
MTPDNHPDPGHGTLLVTGGAGFIGSAFVRLLIRRGYGVVTVDNLGYAGNLANLASVMAEPGHRFVEGSINDGRLLAGLLAETRPRAVVNFAAETHVDRSIDEAGIFVQSNVVGMLACLEAARVHFDGLAGPDRDRFRFLQISTDEVYGPIADGAATEDAPFRPSSPYAASKAAADCLARSFVRTYEFPLVTARCSNNYGPYQFPEKLIPLMIVRALAGKSLPIYGDGRHQRDWLFVEDCCEGILAVLERGAPGADYNIGGGACSTNLDMVTALCAELDRARPRETGGSYEKLIAHVEDRPGHDRRYAIDTAKIGREIGWQPETASGTG